ncbi:MAG: LysM peptidoglycan-binding domain-containing protein [Phycisphaerae bacterium]|nr:LysM peptidoglycan-binding domain-containing protein [Saprospiraceae bacterium]
MKQIILSLAAFFSLHTLQAQDVTYVLFNRDCMNQLEYRYSYPNLKGDNAVWAYSVKPNTLEHYIFMTEGAGHFSPELPDGTVTCRNLDLDDAFVASVNRGAQQMLIVFQRQSGGYWLMPVESATLVARKAAKYWVRSKQSSFQFDTLRLVNEQNLAVAGSPTAAYFSGAKLNNCLMEYSFHCQPVKSGQIRSDFQFIPNVGIVNDRTGNSASSAMENELQLVKVNGMALDDHITEACPEGSGKIAMSKFQKPANYGDDSFESDKEMSSIMQKEQDGESPAEYSKGANGILCAEDWEPGTHIVQKKENLRAIARTYKVSEQDLIKWNKIQNPDLIEICQKLWLKPPPAKAAKKTTSNKGVKAQVYDAQPENTKTVKMQGGTQTQKGTQKSLAQKSKTQKTYDPNRPLEYSDGPANDDDYEYFESETTGAYTRPKIHVVHRGEYLYKIAKMYRCPEECIRIANAMPLEGDEPLTIGQEIIIPECTCTLDGKVLKSPSATTKQPTVKRQNSQGYIQPKKRPSIIEESEAPAEYNYDDDRVYKDEDRYEETSLYDKDGAKKVKVQLYKEHLVRQGETIRSIAAKYKVDSGKLGKLNKPTLSDKGEAMPGKTFLIPIEEDGDEEDNEEDNDPYTRKPTTIKDDGYDPYNYGGVESSGSYSPSSAKTRTGVSTKKPSTANKSYSPAEYDNVSENPKYSGSKRPTTAKQKPRTNILEEDTSDDRSPNESNKTRRYADDDRDDPDGKEIVKPKTRKPQTAGSSTADPKSTQHLVKKGETIQSIADKYDVSPYEISQVNNIGLDDSLIPGKKIWIPVEDGK